MLRQLRTFSRELADGLLALVYPGICAACSRSLPAELSHFCTACRAELTNDPFPTCPRCSSTVGPHSALGEGCPHCRHDVFHFKGVLRLGPYEGRLRELILRMKNSSGEELAEQLGYVWAEHAEAQLRQVGAALVIPVPLHWRRRWTRGFNQSETLAWALAKRLNLPCRTRWLRRIHHNPSQTAQTPTTRRTNVQGIFHAKPSPELRGQTVLLVDDVLTTGSTASAAARALRVAGATRVIVAVLAHGPS